MKGLILLANHFEDTEALTTIDLIKRAKIEIDTVSITENYELITQYNLLIKTDKIISEISLKDYDFLVIPGGKAVFETHLNSIITKNVINYFYEKNLLIACICAAPSILGKMNLLSKIDYTCYPGCEDSKFNGNYMIDKSVVLSKNIITAKAAGSVFMFAYKIIEYLQSKEVADKVLNSIYY